MPTSEFEFRYWPSVLRDVAFLRWRSCMVSSPAWLFASPTECNGHWLGQTTLRENLCHSFRIPVLRWLKVDSFFSAVRRPVLGDFVLEQLLTIHLQRRQNPELHC